MNGHTPGPWELVGATRVWKVGEPGGAVAIMAEPEVRYSDQFREVGLDSKRLREACANARLITAAPDLLAAVRLLIGDLEHREPDGWMSGYVHTKSHDAALAAIAKAEAK